MIYTSRKDSCIIKSHLWQLTVTEKLDQTAQVSVSQLNRLERRVSSIIGSVNLNLLHASWLVSASRQLVWSQNSLCSLACLRVSLRSLYCLVCEEETNESGKFQGLLKY